MISNEEREFARNFINDNCIARVPPGSRKLPAYNRQNGGYYTWQFYLRTALFNPFVLDIVVRDFLDKYEDAIRANRWQFCGVESASTPILTGILLECRRRGRGVHVFSIRKERKTYGLMNWIEGFALDRPAMLIDDLTSESHKTAFHGAHILDDHGIPMAPDLYAAVFKGKSTDRTFRLVNQDVTVESLFDLNDFDLSLEEYNARSTRNDLAEEPEADDRGRQEHRQHA